MTSTAAVNLKDATQADKNERALAKITLSVDPCCYVYLHKVTAAKEAWTKLQNAYQGRSEAAVFDTARKLFNMK